MIMTMHDERWTLGVAENGDVRLRDQKTGETIHFGGSRGLYDALGQLADWRSMFAGKAPTLSAASCEHPGCTVNTEEIDRNARAYGWEIGRRGVAPETVVETSAGNPFTEPNWRDAMHHSGNYGVDGRCGFVGVHDKHPWHDGLCPGEQHNGDHGVPGKSGCPEHGDLCYHAGDQSGPARSARATEPLGGIVGSGKAAAELAARRVRYNALWATIPNDLREWWTGDDTDAFIDRWRSLDLPELTLSDTTDVRLLLWCSDLARAAEMIGAEVHDYSGEPGFEICKGAYSVAVVQQQKETSNA